jgi:hypothetical protein
MGFGAAVPMVVILPADTIRVKLMHQQRPDDYAVLTVAYGTA